MGLPGETVKTPDNLPARILFCLMGIHLAALRISERGSTPSSEPIRLSPEVSIEVNRVRLTAVDPYSLLYRMVEFTCCGLRCYRR